MLGIRSATALLSAAALAALTTGSSLIPPGDATGFLPPTTCDGEPITILGTPGNDTIHGTAGPDVIHGQAGDDVILGMGGDDVICDDTGSNVLRGGAGADRLFDRQHGGPEPAQRWPGRRPAFPRRRVRRRGRLQAGRRPGDRGSCGPAPRSGRGTTRSWADRTWGSGVLPSTTRCWAGLMVTCFTAPAVPTSSTVEEVATSSRPTTKAAVRTGPSTGSSAGPVSDEVSLNRGGGPNVIDMGGDWDIVSGTSEGSVVRLGAGRDNIDVPARSPCTREPTATTSMRVAGRRVPAWCACGATTATTSSMSLSRPIPVP